MKKGKQKETVRKISLNMMKEPGNFEGLDEDCLDLLFAAMFYVIIFRKSPTDKELFEFVNSDCNLNRIILEIKTSKIDILKFVEWVIQNAIPPHVWNPPECT